MLLSMGHKELDMTEQLKRTEYTDGHIVNHCMA